MAFLLDASILGRLANQADHLHAITKAAIATLHRRGERLHVTAQNMIEFHNFATRPVGANGLGLDAQAAGIGAIFETSFSLLDETPDIYPAWKSVVGVLAVLGKQVHNARLVAVCHVHSVTHLLTFNIPHFARFAGIGPGIVVVDPSNV
jgi:hypothetical protein